jgi:hypothetical protein
MAEVKVLGRLNNLAEPLAEVCVIDFWWFLWVFHAYKELQLVEIETLWTTDKWSEIFSRYETIIILIKVEEGFSHRDPVVGEFLAQNFFNFFDFCGKFSVSIARAVYWHAFYVAFAILQTCADSPSSDT